MHVGHPRQCLEIRHDVIVINVSRYSVEQGAPSLAENVHGGEQHKDGEDERANWVGQVCTRLDPERHNPIKTQHRIRVRGGRVGDKHTETRTR